MSLPNVALVCDLVEENWPSMELIAASLLDRLQQDHASVLTATRICPPMKRRFTRPTTDDRRRLTADGQRSAVVDQWSPDDGRRLTVVGQRSSDDGQRSSVNGRPSSVRRFNADRFLNRFWDYPRVARSVRAKFDLFHLLDHSYGQLLHELPAQRTIVTCHDLDTFQCLLNPEQEPRAIYFRKMMERTLNGFRKAAFVTCDSVATRDELLAHGLVPAERMIVIPNGVHPACTPEGNPAADAAAEQLVGGRRAEVGDQRAEFRVSSFEFQDRQPTTADGRPLTVGGRGTDRQSGPSGRIDLLHVGSTIPRKRIDVLLRVFARVKELFPDARLLRVGGAFTAEQNLLVEQLRLRDSIVVLPHLDRDVLAAIYRRAALLLQPSEREGFGLPVVEAMACGTPVVASDLPVLREVGGEAAVYCAMGDVEAWTEAIADLLQRCQMSDEEERCEMSDVRCQDAEARRQAGLAQAAKFSWSEYARQMVEVYQAVLR